LNTIDIAAQHKQGKKLAYWDDLVGGGTGVYKTKRIIDLLDGFGPKTVSKMIDIGCGTCDLLFRLRDKLQARSLTLMDYDAAVIDRLKSQYPDKTVEWVVGDIFEIGKSKKSYDLIFLIDMVHEVYSFYGRPNREVSQPIDHALGMKAVEAILDNVTKICAPGGGIVITDDVLTDEDIDLVVDVRNDKALAAVKYFLENYPTRRITVDWQSPNRMRINSRDFCVLLTQYNKIKAENFDRWNVEKMETHQYYSLAEYRDAFARRGFVVHAEVGTPDDAEREWNEDFAMVSGLPALPAKRISLLATPEAK